MKDLFSIVGTSIRNSILLHSPLATLVGDRIFQMQAFAGAAAPYIIFNYYTGGEDNTTPKNSFDTEWLITAVAETQVQARLMAGYLQDVFKNQEIAYSDGYIPYTVVTEVMPFIAVTDVQQKQYWREGAVYRFRAVEQ